jgi:predicted ATP-grasp superfamily ATP-dependent carboligase
MKSVARNPAVVIDYLTNGIGVIHALSLESIGTALLTPGWPPLECFGRYSRFPKLRVSYWPRHQDSLLNTLLHLSERIDGMGVLFPCSDAQVETFMAVREQLSSRFHVPVASHLGPEFFEKNWQYQLADRVGVATPRYTTFVGGEVPDVQGFRFPLILKPSARVMGAGKFVFRLRLLRTQEDFDSYVELLAREYASRSFQLAENIPGSSDHLYTVGSYSNRDGRALRSYTGRKLSQYPYSHGHGSICETVAVPDEVVGMAQALLNEAGFHGISQVEFKLDARDGLYKLMEINPRSWSWIKLAACSGVNLPAIQYYDLTGDPRLKEALARPQENGSVFVNEYYVIHNRLRAEREFIRESRKTRPMVFAAGLDGEWRLSVSFRAASFIRTLARDVHRLLVEPRANVP